MLISLWTTLQDILIIVRHEAFILERRFNSLRYTWRRPQMLFNIFVIVYTPSMLLSITSHNFNLVIQLLILFVSHSICSLRIVKSSLCWIILILRLWITQVLFCVHVGCPHVRHFCIFEVVFTCSTFGCRAACRSLACWVIDIVDIERLVIWLFQWLLIHIILTWIEAVTFLKERLNYDFFWVFIVLIVHL